MFEPKISILVPTLNSAKTLGACLKAIRDQDYPEDKVEIIVADAGSTDSSAALAHRFGAIVADNPLKTGEAGKTAAAKRATGDILALIDSDNILPERDWLHRMVAPFEDASIAASEPLAYTARPEDPPLVRYFARLGMNDPLCLFLGTYDRTCAVTGKWTELPVETEDRGDYLALTLRRGEVFPTIGANGFLVRRELLPRTKYDPYWFDVDILHDLANTAPDGIVRVAKVKTGIVHLYCDKLEDFERKQNRRVRDFLYFSRQRGGDSPRGSKGRLLRGIFAFSLATVLGFPLRNQARRGQLVAPDSEAWAFHGPVCRATLRIYARATIRKLLGFRQAPASRTTWKQ